MQISNLPKLLPVPFANSGSKQDIPVASQIGVEGGRASYTDGFPPLTRTPIAAGGIPPFGTDFNGVLNDITSAIRWAQAGGGYGYDSTFSSGVSGYPVGARLANSTGDGYWLNTVDGNTNNPETAAASPLTGWVPAESYGVTRITGIGGSSVTLTTLQASKERIELSGTLTANINLIVPAWKKTWKIVNNCTGNFTVTVKTTAGNGISVPAGAAVDVYGDGNNVIASYSAGSLINVQTFTSSATYTPTAGTNLIIVEGIGGGGAGGGAPVTLSGNVGFGCGGHAGAYGKAMFTISEIGASQTISIGSGGAASTGAGGNGGNSTLGSLITFGGGAGGPRVGNTAPPLIAGNGNPSAATSISANIIRGYGQNSTVGFALSTAAIYSSAGASSSYGSGGSSVNTTGNGQSASGFGAGGSGACAQQNNATERLGGSGSPGFIIIYEYA